MLALTQRGEVDPAVGALRLRPLVEGINGIKAPLRRGTRAGVAGIEAVPFGEAGDARAARVGDAPADEPVLVVPLVDVRPEDEADDRGAGPRVEVPIELPRHLERVERAPAGRQVEARAGTIAGHTAAAALAARGDVVIGDVRSPAEPGRIEAYIRLADCGADEGALDAIRQQVRVFL